MVLSNFYSWMLLINAVVHDDSCPKFPHLYQDDPIKITIRNMDPSLLSNEAFLNFGIQEYPVSCVSILGVSTENI